MQQLQNLKETYIQDYNTINNYFNNNMESLKRDQTSYTLLNRQIHNFHKVVVTMHQEYELFKTNKKPMHESPSYSLQQIAEAHNQCVTAYNKV